MSVNHDGEQLKKNNMKKLSILIIWLSISLFAFSASSESCPLSSSESPLEKLSTHLDEILSQVKSLASGSKCTKNEWTGSYLVQADVYRAWVDLNIYQTNTIFYLDTSNFPLLKVLYEHENKIYKMLSNVLETASYVGQSCAERNIADKDISENDSGYNTKWLGLQQILIDLYWQTSHVLAYYRYLATQKNNKYQNSASKFQYVYDWFNKDMETFYRPRNIQVCINEEERKKEMDRDIGEAVTLGGKIVQTLDDWWESFKKLVLPGIDDPYKELGIEDKKKRTNIDELFAFPNWFWDSPYLIDKSLRRESWENPWNENEDENAKKKTSDRASFAETATEKDPQQYYRTIDDFIKKLGSAQPTTIIDLLNYNDDSIAMKNINKYHFSDYLERKLLIEKNSGQDPQTVVWLIRAIEILDMIKPVVENVWTLACNAYDRQATNHPEHQSCEKLTNGQWNSSGS